ncbi:SusC/RagA family TonB-linked outer membrane protein [Flavobacterium tyrosinilyticum]|uniref:SusC/RagA family TonB-linked outer membrane protein n=1 Tax=Flavobacterium tyrosinilyticum TaxID=1658740 RepID=UPI00202FB774|nr:SusC/RagA family TonB-linked outer membrane protein [Flavobacterium tyrosinilyticum]MCM0668731.1 SusC/RagA family TonB-linked outer membrane protein [Flavobacterium tyrosinilyticum]
MKLKFNGFLVLLLVLVAQLTFAQERAVSGTVSDNTGMPLPGVSVLVKGSKTGTQTDFDGKYSIKASSSQVLVFSYIGMKTQEVAASSSVVNVKLSGDAQELEAVVVTTALGIKREKKSLGYSSQKLDEKTVNSTPTNNFLNNLSGKVAGLEVKTNSNFGGSTNIVLRGSKSLTGNNQALMVVDGVAISNDNLNSASSKSGRGGFDFGNSASDIDPNNIESITVLKGAAATALYGSQAANGAIMITTKKGKKNSALGVSFSSTTSMGSYDKDTFIKYQKGYGANGYAAPNDSFYTADVNGDGIPDQIVDMTADASFGNAFNPNLNVYQWTAFAPGNANYGKATPWVAAANDPGKFFQKSFSTVNNVGLSGGDEKGSYNFSYTNNNESGILPNSRLNRNILNGSFTRNLSDKIKTSAFFTFSDQSTVGRNSTGYGDNILTGFRQWWQTNVDVRELKDAYNVNGQNVTWNMNDPLNGNFSPAYWNNPYFDRYKNFSSDDRTRVLAGANISYDITKNFNVLGRVTVDTSNDRQELRKEKGSHAEEFGLQALDETSGYSLYTRSFLQTTYDFIATYDLKISEKISAKLLGGSTFIKSHVDSFDGSTTGGLVAPGLFTLANSMSFVAPIEQEINYNKLGLYTQGSIDYNRIVFVEASYRRDQSTALPQNNNKYDYWSVGTSFIASELIKQDWLNNLKLRANYAVVGNDPAAGLLGWKINNGLIGGNLMFANNSTFVDFKNLRSEKLKSWEFGVEAAMFKNRLSFDVSVYQSNTTDQIFNVPQSTSTGFATSQINAGEMQNKGIEVSLFGSPVKTKDFEWQVGVNWSRNRNEVVSLNQGRDNLQLASWQNGVSLNATVGQPYGTMRGTDYVYDANGNKTVDEDGYYLLATDKVIGNIQADWIGGLSNRFNYKDFSLNFLIDMKKGGSVYSLDQAYGQYTGLYPETAGLNDLGNPLRNSIANGGGIILDGVYEDGTPNQSRIPANMVGAGFGVEVEPNKKFIYDASYVKLREVGFTYNVPSRFLDKTMAKSISFSLLGNNLWIIHKNLPYADPEAGQSSGNVQGFQSGVMPTTKVYSFNIKATF